MPTPRERLVELSASLREAALERGDPVARAAVELVRASIDDIKESLIVAEGDDTIRLQGAARYLQRTFKELTTTPPTKQNVTE